MNYINIMDIQKVVIIGILFIICCLCFYNAINNEFNYKMINVNEVQVKVPYSNVSVINQTDHFSIYEDLENGIKIYVFDDDETTLNDVKEMFNFLTVRDINQMEVISVEDKKFSYNYSSSLNEYTYLNNSNNKNIFVVTKNKENMLNILKSMKINTTVDNVYDNYQEKIIQKTIKYHPTFF